MKTFERLSIIASIAAVGIALGAIVLASNANLHSELRTEMRSLRSDLRDDIRALESRLSAVEQRQTKLEERQTRLEERQARTEGLLEGLRDAIISAKFPAPPAQNEAA